MDNLDDIKERILRDGFAVVDNIFENEEIERLRQVISQIDNPKTTLRKTSDLFAIRRFF